MVSVLFYLLLLYRKMVAIHCGQQYGVLWLDAQELDYVCVEHMWS